MQKYLLIFLFFLSSCLDKLEHDISVPISVMHMESLYEYNPKNISIDSMRQAYGYFWDVYTQHIISLPYGDSFVDSLNAFQKNQDYQKAYKQIKSNFSDYNAADLTKGLQRYHHYFPNKILPKVVTFYGGFNYPIVTTDSVLGIGLEMFLGKYSDFYMALSHKYPPYMHQQFQANHIASLGLKGWLGTEFILTSKNFLEQMVHQGKIQYVLSELLPNTPDSVLMGYSKSQMEWCENNEFLIWQFLIERDLLYSTDQMLIMKYMNPAPNTRGMPLESPGRVACWIGWRIVSAYMNSHPHISLNDLMQIKDAQYILTRSKYKP